MASTVGVLDKSLLYERVRETLRERCRQEDGSTLPSLRQLSSELDVNHFTISRALRDLEAEGIVKILPRRGIFIQQQTRQPKHKRVELATFNSGLKNISSCLVQGVEEIAGNGMIHHTMLGQSPLPDGDTFLSVLKERSVEAVVFNGVSYSQYPHSLDEANLIHRVAQELPIVIVGSPHQIVVADCVYGDTRPAMRQYLEACRSKGFARFSFLGATRWRPANNERFECFKDFILAHRLQWDESWIIYDTQKTYRESVRQMLAQPIKPQVIIAYSASCAYAAIIEVQRCGLQPGRDVHILTFASLMSDVDALTPDATVVFIDEIEVGRRAYRLLQEKSSAAVGASSLEPCVELVPARFINNLLEE